MNERGRPDEPRPNTAGPNTAGANEEQTPAVPTVHQQLLDAALETATVHGIAKLSMGDVARRAGLSRQTLYRHFASKDALVAAVVAAQTELLIEEVTAASLAEQDPRDSLEAAFAAALRVTRDHPLLDRLLRTEPESLLPLLTSDGGPVMTMVRAAVEQVLALQQPGLDAVTLRRLADIVTRLLVSYAVSAPDDPPEVVSHHVATFLIHGSALTSEPALTHDSTRGAGR